MTLLHRESLERLSQQERCIAGLEARLAEAKIANQEHAAVVKNQEARMAKPQQEANITNPEASMAKNQEANIVDEEARTINFEARIAEENNNRGMIAQMADKLTKRSKEVEDPTTIVEVGGGGSRRGSSSSREFREDEEDLEELDRKGGGERRGSSSSREFQHEGEVSSCLDNKSKYKDKYKEPCKHKWKNIQILIQS